MDLKCNYRTVGYCQGAHAATAGLGLWCHAGCCCASTVQCVKYSAFKGSLIFIIYACMSDFLYVHHIMTYRFPGRPEEGITAPLELEVGIGVRATRCGYWKLNPGLRQGRQILLPTSPNGEVLHTPTAVYLLLTGAFAQ